MIPLIPSRPPYQCSSDGWQGEFAGTHGPLPQRPEWQFQEVPAVEGYFVGPVDRPSSVELQGQPHVGDYVATDQGANSGNPGARDDRRYDY
jgi:hypothetical protein